MTLTLELPDDLAAEFTQAPGGERVNFAVVAIRRLLEDGTDRVPEHLTMTGAVQSLDVPNRRRVLHEGEDAGARVAAFRDFLQIMQEDVSQDTPSLSDFAVSREGIYEE